MLGAFVLCFAVRLFQIVLGTDMTTGFLYHDNGFLLDWGYYALAALAFVLAIVFAVYDGKKGTFQTASISDITDIRAAVLGFGMLIIGLCSVYDGFLEKNAISPLNLVIFVDFVFGAAMVVIAFATLYMKEFKPWLGFSYAVAGVYFTLRAVAVFLERMVIATVPEYMIECITVICGAVFFMLLSKLLSGNEKKLTRISLCGFGVVTAVLSLSSSFATITAWLTAPEEISSRITPSSYEAELYFQNQAGVSPYKLVFTPWVNVAMGLTAAAVVIVLFMRSKKSASAEVNEPAEE